MDHHMFYGLGGEPSYRNFDREVQSLEPLIVANKTIQMPNDTPEYIDDSCRLLGGAVLVSGEYYECSRLDGLDIQH